MSTAGVTGSPRSVRVYAPVTPADLRALVAGSAIEVAVAWAVTASSRAAHGPTVDEEEMEFLAMSSAAQACLADAASPVVRIVLAADVPDSDVEDGQSPDGGVRLLRPLARTDVASVHTDSAPVEPGADLDAGDLQWYAVQEIDDLVTKERA